MNEQSSTPSKGSDNRKAYVGALVPLRLYTCLVEESEQKNVSCSELLRRALANRYGEAHERDSLRSKQRTIGEE
jgi:hypothetical protein